MPSTVAREVEVAHIAHGVFAPVWSCSTGLISQAQRGEAPNVSNIGPDTPPPTLAPGVLSDASPSRKKATPAPAPPAGVAALAAGSSPPTESDDDLDAVLAQAQEMIVSSDKLLQKNAEAEPPATDPKEHAAATKIQAAFRGHLVRATMFESESEGSGDATGDEDDADATATKAPWPSPDEPGGVITGGSIAERAKRKQSGRLRNTKRRAQRLNQKLDELLAEEANSHEGEGAAAEPEILTVPEKLEAQPAQAQLDTSDYLEVGGEGEVQPIALAAEANSISAPSAETRESATVVNTSFADIDEGSPASPVETKSADAPTPASTAVKTAEAKPVVKEVDATASVDPVDTSKLSTATASPGTTTATAPAPAVADVGAAHEATDGAEKTSSNDNGQGQTETPPTQVATAAELSTTTESAALETSVADVPLRGGDRDNRPRVMSSASRLSIRFPGGLPPPPADSPPTDMERTMADSVQGLQAQLRLAWDANDELQATVAQQAKQISDLKAQLSNANQEHERQLNDLRAQSRKKKNKKGCTVA